MQTSTNGTSIISTTAAISGSVTPLRVPVIYSSHLNFRREVNPVPVAAPYIATANVATANVATANVATACQLAPPATPVSGSEMTMSTMPRAVSLQPVILISRDPLPPQVPTIFEAAGVSSSGSQAEFVEQQATKSKPKRKLASPRTLVNLSYVHIIREAINAKGGKATLAQIYKYFEENHSYITNPEKGEGKTWKNSIRHALSVNKTTFELTDKTPEKKHSHYWIVKLDAPPSRSRDSRNIINKRRRREIKQ